MTARVRYLLAVPIAAVLTVGSAAEAAAQPGVFGSATTRVSVKSNEAQVFSPSSQSEMSIDGRFVAFVSSAATLVPGDTNGRPDVFLRDRVAGTTTRVSLTASDGQGNGRSDLPSISRDGRYVAFYSEASNLVAGDTNGKADAFVRDLVAGTTRRVSVASNGAQANNESGFVSISDDGQRIAFSSLASNLVSGDGNGASDIFLRDLGAGTTRRLSVSSNGAGGNQPSALPDISGDGAVVAFVSDATNLVPGDTNSSRDVFVRVVATNTTQLVSVGAGGEPVAGFSDDPAISRNGRYIAFSSSASNIVAGDTDLAQDVFVRDRTAATTRLVSDGPAVGTGLSSAPDIAENGQVVVFLTQPTAPGSASVVHRRAGAGPVQLASIGVGGSPANGPSFGAGVSPDGQHVGFTSNATNLVAGDTNNNQDVFVRD